ncbi:MAG: DinB family protein [Thermoanaerobaculia bacterium]|nr:DinB family protein [Thermoanaerobaculia bacterium]
MIQSIAAFTAAWSYEHEATLKIFRALTDPSLAQRVTPEGRSLGFLAWHIVQTLGEMPQHAALPVDAPGEDVPVPASAGAIADEFDKAAKSVAKVVPATWSDASLGDDVSMYGQTWKKGDVLSSLILHQAHHRGQMTVLMRQAGLMVPGIYGPAKEEWAAMGMPAPQ